MRYDSAIISFSDFTHRPRTSSQPPFTTSAAALFNLPSGRDGDASNRPSGRLLCFDEIGPAASGQERQSGPGLVSRGLLSSREFTITDLLRKACASENTSSRTNAHASAMFASLMLLSFRTTMRGGIGPSLSTAGLFSKAIVH